MGVFDPSDGFDNFGEPRLQLVQELEEVLRQLGHEADGAADRAEEDGASVRDAGVGGIMSTKFRDIFPTFYLVSPRFCMTRLPCWNTLM